MSSPRFPEIKWEDDSNTDDDDIFGSSDGSPRVEEPQSPSDSKEFESVMAAEKASGYRPPSILVGQKIKGKIVFIHPERQDVLVDLGGGKLTGVIEKPELLDEKTGELIVKVGDPIEAFVVSKVGDEVLLSYRMNAALKSLDDLAMAQAKKIPVKGKVLKLIKGGFEIAIFGKVGFCPISKIDARFVENGQEYIGQDLEFLVEKVEGKGRNIVLNRSALLKKKAEEKTKALLVTLKEDPERIWTGTVTELRDFGAFVDLGGVDGLVHISELSHGRVQKAGDAVSKGAVVKVKVLKIEQDAQGKPKISLSMKATSQDPWEQINDLVASGKTYPGTVVNLMPFGAFIEIVPGIEGLIHVTEMSWTKRIHHPSDVLKLGERVNVLVKDIDRAHRRIALTMKSIEDDPWHGVDALVGTTVQATIERLKPFGAIVTIKDGLSGLIPLTTLKKRFGEAYKQPATPGKQLEVKVQQVDHENRKILLTLGGLEDEDSDDAHYLAYLAAEKAQKEAQAAKSLETAKGEAGGSTKPSGSFGALLGAKLSQKNSK